MKQFFKGEIVHTEKTLRQLFRTEYETYERKKIFVWMGVGALMIVLAILVEMSMPLRVILLLIACWLLVSSDFPAEMRADKVVDTRRGSLPSMSYEFYDKDMKLESEGSMRMKYDKFQRLIEDSDYLYLFEAKNSVCMLDKDSIQGGSVDQFKEFMEKRTGLEWRRCKSILSLSLTDIIQSARDRRARRL